MVKLIIAGPSIDLTPGALTIPISHVLLYSSIFLSKQCHFPLHMHEGMLHFPPIMLA